MHDNDIKVVFNHIFMVKDYDKDNLIIIKCIFCLFYPNSNITKNIIYLKIFIDLHDVTEMGYIDINSVINISANAL